MMKLPFKFTSLFIGVLLLFTVPFILTFFKREPSVFISTFILSTLMSGLILYKYANTLRVEGASLYIPNILGFTRKIPLQQIQRITLYSEKGFLMETLCISLRIGQQHKRIHLGTLSAQHLQALYDYLQQQTGSPVEFQDLPHL